MSSVDRFRGFDGSGGTYTDDDMFALTGLEVIESFCLFNTDITDDGVAVLEKAINLRRLEIQSNIVTDRCLKVLRRLPRLQSLALHEARWLTNTGVAHMAACTGLVEVQIADSRISDPAMAVLCGLPELRSLFLQTACGITDQGVSELEKRQSLVELCLVETELTDYGAPSFVHLSGLRSVDLSWTKISDGGLVGFGEMKDLKALGLTATAITGATLDALPSGIELTLVLCDCPVTEEAVVRIARHFTRLKRLDLSGTQITDDCLPALAAASCRVRLKNTQVTQSAVRTWLGKSRLY